MSKTNDFTTARLAEVHMSAHARLRAQAHMERAEAMADTLVWLANGLSRLLGSLTARPARRLSTSG